MRVGARSFSTWRQDFDGRTGRAQTRACAVFTWRAHTCKATRAVGQNHRLSSCAISAHGMHMACVDGDSSSARADIRRPCDMHTARRAYRLHHGILVLYLTYVHAAWHAQIRSSRRATARLRTPQKSGSWDARPGPISGMGWDTALRGHILCIYVTPRHPTSHVTSRACTHDAHFMPCCMRCLHALRGRPVQARIAPPRATGLVSSSPWVDVLPPMAGYPGGVR